MPVFKNDPFPGVDYSAYQSWQKFTTPDGQTYYVVPGNEGYIFDPVASAATGRKVFRRNPKKDFDAEAEKKRQNDELLAQQKYNQSLAGQAVPVALSTGGLIAASQFMPGASGTNALVQAMTEGASGAGMSAGAGATTAADAALSGAGDTSISNFAGSATPYLGAAGTALGAYNAYEGIKKHNPIQAGLGGAGAGLGINAMGYALGPWGWAAMAGIPIAASLLGGGGIPGFSHKSTKEIEADRWAGTGANPDIVNAMAGGHDYFAGTGGEKSRDEKFLTPDAIRVNPDNYHAAPDWDQWSKAQQDEFLSTLLNEGKVREKKGGIYYDDARAAELAAQIRAKGQPQTGGR